MREKNAMKTSFCKFFYRSSHPRLRRRKHERSTAISGLVSEDAGGTSASESSRRLRAPNIDVMTFHIDLESRNGLDGERLSRESCNNTYTRIIDAIR